MNLGVETFLPQPRKRSLLLFQHSLMNLGVETFMVSMASSSVSYVSAFSDESWGGDQRVSTLLTHQDLCFSIL